MLTVLSAGIAPGLALLCYFYLKDQYETEPLLIVLKMFIYGGFLTLPVMFIQYVFSAEGIVHSDFLQAFFSSGMIEELFKWLVLFYAIYGHAEFDEPYDGIVYATSVLLGFATVENILYLIANGVEFAFSRALLPVSSHALFGVIMGYYLGKSKFSSPGKKRTGLFLSLFLPFVLHGLYDYILFLKETWMYVIIPFMLFLWWLGLKKVKDARIVTEHYKKGLLSK